MIAIEGQWDFSNWQCQGKDCSSSRFSWIKTWREPAPHCIPFSGFFLAFASQPNVWLLFKNEFGTDWFYTLAALEHGLARHHTTLKILKQSAFWRSHLQPWCPISNGAYAIKPFLNHSLRLWIYHSNTTKSGAMQSFFAFSRKNILPFSIQRFANMGHQIIHCLRTLQALPCLQKLFMISWAFPTMIDQGMLLSSCFDWNDRLAVSQFQALL